MLIEDFNQLEIFGQSPPNRARNIEILTHFFHFTTGGYESIPAKEERGCVAEKEKVMKNPKSQIQSKKVMKNPI